MDRDGLAREGRRRQALEALEFERARGTALRERLETFVTEIDGPAVDEAVFDAMSAEEAAVVRAELQPHEPVPIEPEEPDEGESPEDEAEPVEALHAAEIDRLQREIASSKQRQRAFERYLELLAQGLADERAVETPSADAAPAAFRKAQRAGHGGLDYSAVYLTTTTGPEPKRSPLPPARRFPEGALRGFGERALERYAVPPAAARLVLDCLLEADRRGVHTHGLLRLPAYCAQARAGEIDVGATPEVVHQSGPTALVDGRLTFGAVSGTFAADDAVRRAREHGIGATAVRNGSHFGSAGHYSLRIARQGLVGLAACSTPAAMAPWGAAESRLGNNPISIAAPSGGERAPLVLDMALSAVSRGAIKLAELNGRQIPDGWALDPEGNPTTDPVAALAGSLLPLGGHKGSGLAVAIEFLTAALAGAEISPHLVNTGLTGGSGRGSFAGRGGTGFLMLALDPDRFGGRELFLSRTAELIDELKASRLAPGFGELVVPGELEHRSELLADVEGVCLPAVTVEALQTLAAAVEVTFPLT